MIKVVLAALLAGSAPAATISAPAPQPDIGARAKPVLTVGTLRFHDLDGDGRLAPYEDWRLPPEARAADLARRMTLAEKAGLLMHGTPPTIDGSLAGHWDMAQLRDAIAQSHIRFFISRLSGDPADLARSANAAQEIAEGGRLGIPIVFSSDPRNQVKSTFGLTADAGRFSLWPEPTGLGAIGDPALVERFGRTIAVEYRAVGIRMALSPMADLATEPRWPRVNGTFGDDPTGVSPLVAAYIAGLQGGQDGVASKGVAAVVKHWVGYGAEPGGLDAHNPYGKRLSFPSGNIMPHVAPFLAAFKMKAAGVMPTYAILPPNILVSGRPAEQVGGAFNKALLTDWLRGRYGFGGIILSDWKVTDDCRRVCEEGTLNIDALGMPWGVEQLSKAERFAKAINAGVDQFGGVMDAGVIVKLAQSGAVTVSRVDQSVQRLLALMFRLGLFENPYVDPEAAERIVGSPDDRAAGIAAQEQSLTLLVNNGGLLPLAATRPRKVWLFNIAREAALAEGLRPVNSPEEADVSILRVATPYTQHKDYFFGARHHEGMPEFQADNAGRRAVERASAAGKPVIVSIYLERPAILTPLLPHITALIGDYGVEDHALLEVILGKAAPQGRLPFELPSSASGIAAQKADLPSDSKDPLFRRGFGLRFHR